VCGVGVGVGVGGGGLALVVWCVESVIEPVYCAVVRCVSGERRGRDWLPSTQAHRLPMSGTASVSGPAADGGGGGGDMWRGAVAGFCLCVVLEAVRPLCHIQYLSISIYLTSNTPHAVHHISHHYMSCRYIQHPDPTARRGRATCHHAPRTTTTTTTATTTPRHT
jgi:hypothetical protein